MTVDMALQTTILAGTSSGRQWFLELMDKAKDEPSQPQPILLDFCKAEIATASFLREAVLEFRDCLRRRRSKWFPVPANCHETVLEELRMLVENTNTALVVCDLGESGLPQRPRLLGKLDPKQQYTFRLVQQHKEVDAITLSSVHSEEERPTAPTAWNNRLASLVKLGVVVELDGRPKKYRALLQEDE